MIADILKESARKHGPRLCLRSFSEGDFSTISYEQLDRLASSVAACIISRGIGETDRVCIVSENRPEWAVSYLGILRAGCVIVPLDSLSKPADIRYLVRRAQARMVFCSAKFVKDLEEIRDSGKAPPALVCFDKTEGLESLEELIAEGEEAIGKDGPSERRVPEDSDAVIIFTSGTTGASKGVVLSHRNICFDVEATVAAVPLDENDRFLSVLPLHHTFESTAGLLAPLSRGASVSYARSVRSKEILADLLACDATVLLLVPLMFEKMALGIKRAVARAPLQTRVVAELLLWVSAFLRRWLRIEAGSFLLKSLRRKSGMGSLRFAISGAAPLSHDVQAFFGTLGVPILEGYGLTETSPVAAVNRPGHLRPGSVGPPIPGVEMRIDNPDSQGLGEILVRGQNVMKGYLESPEMTSQVLSDGWLRTGDLGRIDADGYLYIGGRSKNVIVTQAGKKIFPEEVEAVLAGSPFIAEVVVMGVKSATSGREEVHALVYPDFEQLQVYAEEQGIKLDEERMEGIIRSEIGRLSARLPDYKRVRNFTLRSEEFPKTSTKKIKRHALLGPAESQNE